MGCQESYNQACKMAEKIMKCYKVKGVSLTIKDKGILIHGNTFEFKLKIQKDTRVELISRFAKDVKLYLKLEVFEIREEDTGISIIAAKERLDDNRLLSMLQSSEYMNAINTMSIVHIIGRGLSGNLVIMDLEKYPHLVVAGSTRSGKSMALKCLIVSMLAYSPLRLNLLIGDGASELTQFIGMPNLSYPIIEDADTLREIMLIVREEMNRRIDIKNTDEFKKLPSIVCVIDEFNSFISGIGDKRQTKQMTEVLSEILRRGRHARIHLILASHNPTKTSMMLDTSDIPAKMVFRVSRVCNSVAVLGKGGAEKLKGEGDVLFSLNGEIQHLQGAYISSKDIDMLLGIVRSRYILSPKRRRRRSSKFIITKEKLQQKKDDEEKACNETGMLQSNRCQDIQKKQNLLFAKVALWTLEQKSISCNMISEVFNMGWRRANCFIKRLYDFGVIEELDAKLPRKVLPQSIEEVPEELKKFFVSNGISLDTVANAFQKSL